MKHLWQYHELPMRYHCNARNDNLTEEKNMWLIFGTVAMIAAILNLIWTIRKHEAKWFRFISLSFTALTLCAFYTQAKQWVLMEAADQLLDVMPTLS